jgi:hypothetical protein
MPAKIIGDNTKALAISKTITALASKRFSIVAVCSVIMRFPFLVLRSAQSIVLGMVRTRGSVFRLTCPS